MQQFDMHRLLDPDEDRLSNTLVVILQHRHARAVDTVIVAPVVPGSSLPSLERIRPPVNFEGKQYVVAVDRLAAVERHSVGPRVGSLEPHRDDLIRAIDTLVTGF